MATTLSQQEIDAAVRDAWGEELARLWIRIGRPKCKLCGTPLEPREPRTYDTDINVPGYCGVCPCTCQGEVRCEGCGSVYRLAHDQDHLSLCPDCRP